MRIILKIIFPVILLCSAGCMSWDEGWKTKAQATGQGDVKALLAAAAAVEAAADSADKVKAVLAAYEKVIAVDPGNYDALCKLGEFNHLYAYVYAADKKTKGEYYLKSLACCERAMYTNPKFRELADKGKRVWECADALTEKEMFAMFYWYVAAGQYWTECLNPVTRLLNFYWTKRANTVLQRMTALKPDWWHGLVHMSWGAYHAIAPGVLGGDLKKSAEELDKAIKIGPDSLVHYYVRARYLHVKNGDRKAFEKDLEHVISADIKKIKHDYAWNAGYQKKAKELLAQKDKLF